jgi:ketosteroid isomerase-like protein
MRRFAPLALVLATSWLLSACAPLATDAPRDPAAAVAELTRLSKAWDEAIVRKDRAAIADHMTEDFRQIGSSGEVETKTSFVRDIVDDALVIDPYTVEDFEVRVYGDTALLSGHTRMTGRFAGKPFSTHYRYIDVYVRVNGRWKVCSVQTTRIAAP